jgi:flagellar basal-body rod modification protein FlgD
MSTTVPPTGSSTTPKSASPASASSGASSSVDYNAFLQLLVQEMKNQDPTSPSDPTQYLSQIASFSNVEQSVQTNTKLATLLTSSALTQAENAIGKTVTSSDGTVTGVVKSVALASDGTASATLSNGSTLTLDNTVRVSGS